MRRLKNCGPAVASHDIPKAMIFVTAIKSAVSAEP